MPPTGTSLAIPFKEKNPQSTTFPPSCLTEVMALLGLKASSLLLQTKATALCSKSSILASSDHRTKGFFFSGRLLRRLFQLFYACWEKKSLPWTTSIKPMLWQSPLKKVLQNSVPESFKFFRFSLLVTIGLCHWHSFKSDWESGSQLTFGSVLWGSWQCGTSCAPWSRSGRWQQQCKDILRWRCSRILVRHHNSWPLWSWLSSVVLTIMRNMDSMNMAKTMGALRIASIPRTCRCTYIRRCALFFLWLLFWELCCGDLLASN